MLHCDHFYIFAHTKKNFTTTLERFFTAKKKRYKKIEKLLLVFLGVIFFLIDAANECEKIGAANRSGIKLNMQ